MIAIVDYGMGNLGSILNMMRRLDAPAMITSDPVALAQAEKLILPGVGTFDRGMGELRARGLLPVLEEFRLSGRHVLGICLGMQLLARRSEEGTRAGLSWIDADVIRLRTTSAVHKVPHMGWNTVSVRGDSTLLSTGDVPRYYFVHSFHVVCDQPADVLGTTWHGEEFVSAIGRENVLGVQFHPEKSHRFGMELLRRFADVRAVAP